MTPSDIEKSIETWRIQFEKTQDSEYLRRLPSGSYQWSFIEERFAGFVIAMKSLVVELPKVEMCFGSKPFPYVNAHEMIESLQSAGINYRERE
jgi:hypothetical protein